MQWNIRGVVANGEELQILLSNFNPEVVFFLQETLRVTYPKLHTDFRPISVTPVLIGVLEHLAVTHFLYPSFSLLHSTIVYRSVCFLLYMIASTSDFSAPSVILLFSCIWPEVDFHKPVLSKDPQLSSPPNFNKIWQCIVALLAIWNIFLARSSGTNCRRIVSVMENYTVPNFERTEISTRRSLTSC